MEYDDFKNDMEEWISKLIESGTVGIRQYLEGKISPDVKGRLRGREIRNIWKNIQEQMSNDADIQKKIAEKVLDAFTYEGDMHRNPDVIWFKEADGTNLPNANILSSGRTPDSVSKYDRAKLLEFLKKKSPYFSESGYDLTKKKIIGQIIRIMIAFDKRTTTGTKEMAFGEEEDVEEKKIIDDMVEVIQKYTFRREKAKKLTDIPRNIKEEEIRLDSGLKQSELEVHLEKLQVYIDSINPDSRLRMIQRAIRNRLENKEPIFIVETNVDDIVAKLDLKISDRRSRIYNYWEKIHKQEAEVTKAVKEFQKITEAIAKDRKGFDSDLVDLCKEFNEIDADKISYILEFDTKNEEYRKAMVISRIASPSVAAMKILVDLYKERKIAGSMQTREELRGVPDKELRESLSTATAREGEESTISPTFDDKDQLTGFTEERVLGNIISDEEVDDLSSEIESLAESVPDPLFYYVYSEGGKASKNILNDMALMKKDFERIRAEVEYLSKGTPLNPRVIDPTSSEGYQDLQEYLDKLQRELIDDFEGKVFHLPFTPKLETQLGRTIVGGTEKTTEVKLRDIVVPADKKDNTKNVESLIRITSSFENYGEKLMRTAPPIFTGPSPAIRGGSKSLAFGTTQTGRETGKDIRPNMKTFHNAYANLLKNITSYYLIPCRSRYLPFDDEPTFMVRQFVNDLLSFDERDDSIGLRVVANLERKQNFGFLDEEAVEEMTKVLRNVSSPKSNREAIGLVKQFEKLVEIVDTELMEDAGDADIEKEVSIELGAGLNRILEKNNVVETVEFMGKPTEEWDDEFKRIEEGGGRVYPFEAIANHLSRLEIMYKDANPDVILGKNKMVSAASAFNSALNAIGETVVKQDEKVVLEAHDMIRKMQGQPVYYCYGKLDNFEHVSETIDILKKDYHTDVTAHELENIVLDYDTHDTLSKKYGVSKDVIYVAKSMFR